ncbi:MAG: hypothetical protein ACUVQP_05405 [Bacteroidales bacterium]
MKSLKTLILIILPNLFFGQVAKILEIREMPEYDKEAFIATNKLRSSLGLKTQTRKSYLDSAARHHAYYTAYCLAYDKFTAHEETFNIPNFKEKKLSERAHSGNVAEIMMRFWGEIEDPEEDIETEFNRILEEENFKTFGDFYLESYKKSPAHYNEIIKSENYLTGISTLLVSIQKKGKKPYVYMITVTVFKFP